MTQGTKTTLQDDHETALQEGLGDVLSSAVGDGLVQPAEPVDERPGQAVTHTEPVVTGAPQAGGGRYNRRVQALYNELDMKLVDASDVIKDFERQMTAMDEQHKTDMAIAKARHRAEIFAVEEKRQDAIAEKSAIAKTMNSLLGKD